MELHPRYNIVAWSYSNLALEYGHIASALGTQHENETGLRSPPHTVPCAAVVAMATL